jgi:glycosyltransferase involved in cell wall biosynthesis
MRKTLSVVLATFNEEKNLAGCLDSVKDLADEIIIVDGTSTDKTVEIAKEYNAKVKITTNKQNFHINKQMAIDMATKDWILQLDADEHISKEQTEEIKEILEKDSKEFNGYWMPRKNLFLGRFLMKGGQYPDYTLRLYRKGKGKLPQKDVHEQAVVEGKVGYLKSALLHYPYKSFSHYLRKWNLYNNLLATQIKEEQDKKNILQKIFYAFAYLVAKPGHWLLTTFIRHKGFMDSWQGFTFSLFSALRFPVSYLKYLGVYKILVFFLIIFSFLIRFWDYPHRWGLGGDDGRDAMIALEAIKRHELPLMGPFSSAGPFVFGGIYYWLIMSFYLALPFLISAPWIFTGLIGVLTVGLFVYLGKLLGGKKFSLILGLLAAFSPQLFVRSLMLGPHTYISTLTVLLIISFVLLWQKKKVFYAFLMGIFLGIALGMHYQAVNLFVFFPAIFVVSSLSIKNRIKALFLMVLGFLIPSFPLLYWDYHQNFANVNNILDYLLIAQYRIYVPNSWKIFLFDFIPWYWSFVVGRFYLISLLIAAFSPLVFIFLALKKKIKGEFILLGILFFIFIFVNRFYKGERSEGYLLYLAPFILIFTTLLINYLVTYKNKIVKVLGVLLLAIIILGNLLTIKNSFLLSPVATYKNVYKEIVEKFPNSKFSIYAYKYKLYDQSMALSLIMGFDGKISDDGIPLGVSCYGIECPKHTNVVVKSGVLVLDLRTVKKEDMEKSKQLWINVNQKNAYDDLIGWLNKNELKSTFSLKNYIMEKIGRL